MTRQQKRKEIRDLNKEYGTIVKSPVFKVTVITKELDNLSEEDKNLLKDKKHPNKKLQARFNLGVLMFSRLRQIELRVKYLSDPLIDKKDISHVQ
jgi:hypothetical protein